MTEDYKLLTISEEPICKHCKNCEYSRFSYKYVCIAPEESVCIHLMNYRYNEEEEENK